MLNQVVIVGKVVEMQELKTTEIDKKRLMMVVEVQRPFKNKDGEYDKDYICVKTYGLVAEKTKESCQKGDIVGLKGWLSNLVGESLEFIAEKVTFLSKKKESEEK